MEVSAHAMVGTILQSVSVLNQHVVHSELTQPYMSIISKLNVEMVKYKLK